MESTATAFLNVSRAKEQAHGPVLTNILLGNASTGACVLNLHEYIQYCVIITLQHAILNGSFLGVHRLCVRVAPCEVDILSDKELSCHVIEFIRTCRIKTVF